MKSGSINSRDSQPCISRLETLFEAMTYWKPGSFAGSRDRKINIGHA